MNHGSLASCPAVFRFFMMDMTCSIVIIVISLGVGSFVDDRLTSNQNGAHSSSKPNLGVLGLTTSLMDHLARSGTLMVPEPSND